MMETSLIIAVLLPWILSAQPWAVADEVNSHPKPETNSLVPSQNGGLYKRSIFSGGTHERLDIFVSDRDWTGNITLPWKTCGGTLSTPCPTILDGVESLKSHVNENYLTWHANRTIYVHLLAYPDTKCTVNTGGQKIFLPFDFKSGRLVLVGEGTGNCKKAVIRDGAPDSIFVLESDRYLSTRNPPLKCVAFVNVRFILLSQESKGNSGTAIMGTTRFTSLEVEACVFEIHQAQGAITFHQIDYESNNSLVIRDCIFRCLSHTPYPIISISVGMQFSATILQNRFEGPSRMIRLFYHPHSPNLDQKPDVVVTISDCSFKQITASHAFMAGASRGAHRNQRRDPASLHWQNTTFSASKVSKSLLVIEGGWEVTISKCSFLNNFMPEDGKSTALLWQTTESEQFSKASVSRITMINCHFEHNSLLQSSNSSQSNRPVVQALLISVDQREAQDQEVRFELSIIDSKMSVDGQSSKGSEHLPLLSAYRGDIRFQGYNQIW